MPSPSKPLLESLEMLGAKTGLSVERDLSQFPLVCEKKQLFPYSFVKKHLLLPIKEDEQNLYIAIANPFDLEAVQQVKFLTDKNLVEILTSKSELEATIEACYRQKDEETAKYIQDLGQADDSLEVSFEHDNEYDLLDLETDSHVIKLLNMILAEGLQQGASDVHFDPAEKGIVVRYRVDGALSEKHSLPKEVKDQLITRIKVLASLDIAEHRLPQDGRIKLRMGGRIIDFRVSCIPVVYGERVVLRILDRGQVKLGLDKLGMNKELLDSTRRLIRQNQGIILVTGPTGSGKTTTLYSALSEIRSEEVNIMTIEDPVEFKLDNMAQISVNQKINLSFATGLKHILRQDPDVIMIGEIRDRETAEIAIQASLTGHLVLSTLHTNDAPSAITRLVDMGVEPFLLSSSVIGVLAQRLVRKICPHCKTFYKPEREEIAELGLTNTSNGLVFYQGEGCHQCFYTGYKGRLGLYELMPITYRMKRQIAKSADSSELQKVALEEGMSSLRGEGAKAVCEGITTFKEVLRVTRQIDEEIL